MRIDLNDRVPPGPAVDLGVRSRRRLGLSLRDRLGVLEGVLQQTRDGGEVCAGVSEPLDRFASAWAVLRLAQADDGSSRSTLRTYVAGLVAEDVEQRLGQLEDLVLAEIAIGIGIVHAVP